MWYGFVKEMSGRLPFTRPKGHYEYLVMPYGLTAQGQARWALFFTRFKFSVVYHPGSQNGKADALSQRHDHHSSPTYPEHILPPSVVIAPV
ncbi:hypothetical protein QTP86_005004 [Hemibagrus guttatus]|nr:hypothetical protein QTP86_005004 [Hemibagrus guttatus]